MNTATNNDLKELKDLITQLNDRIETRFNEVDRLLSLTPNPEFLTPN